VSTDGRVEDLLRDCAPQVLGALVRRYGQFEACEDAVQEALLAAALQWPGSGVPDNPHGWLLTVATRRLTDHWRSESARRQREVSQAALAPVGADVPDRDDTLTLLFLCCHPDLSPPSQVALTLRAVGGLTTAEVAAAFLVPEATMSQRIRRAKASLKASTVGFQLPGRSVWDGRLRVVLHVLYLIFNEGYTASSGPDLQRADLTAEAIRLTRAVHRRLPDDGEVAGLLALMLLTDARRPARTAPDGSLVPLSEQDRSSWSQVSIAEGRALVEQALARGPVGPYQLQAAIAAVHSEARSPAETDWAQIKALYDVLARLEPSPMVTLNHAVAVGMADGPKAGLAMLETLDGDERLAGHHRLDAVRAHLLELSGEVDEARDHYRRAAQRTTSTPERRYLEARAARLGADAS
jgi:RNA polymerase sigma factor (sigma-70 family)